MIIEVPGIWVHNRGALLMLEAIREQVGKAYPTARLAVPTIMPRASRRSLDVLGVLPAGGTVANRVKRIFPNILLKQFGLVKWNAVNVVLDASGFGYGDYWGKDIISRRLVQRLDGWRRPNRVSILLPQAYGPFSLPGMKEIFAQGLEQQDLVFVRDRVSMRHVVAVAPSLDKVRSAPDFTNLLHPTLPSELEQWRDWSFVVPNEKMVAGERALSRAKYVDFMSKAVQELIKSGRKAALLVHEGDKDLQLAVEINDKLINPVPVLNCKSPLDTKALIANADVLISSRFHGLVSGLSNAVPSLACGWSHKYGELMQDYGVPELSIVLDSNEGAIHDVRAFLVRASGSTLRIHLAERAEEQRVLSQNMWRCCFTLIDNATGARASA